MSLTLHFHPLASFCHKALIALYENDTPFTPKLVDLANETERAALLKLWPIGKFPVLRDEARDQTIPESSIIIEYLDRHYPGRIRFIPDDADHAWQMRLRDRFYDLYVHLPMQKIMLDRLRAEVLRRCPRLTLVTDYLTDPSRNSVAMETTLKPARGVKNLEVYVRMDATA